MSIEKLERDLRAAVARIDSLENRAHRLEVDSLSRDRDMIQGMNSIVQLVDHVVEDVMQLSQAALPRLEAELRDVKTRLARWQQ